MLQKEYDDGVRNIIATPHFRYDMFEPSLEQVKKQFLRVRKAAAEIGEDGIQMYLGCELHSSMDMTDCLKKGERLTMSGSRYVLTEFRTSDEKSYIRAVSYTHLAISRSQRISFKVYQTKGLNQ